MNRWTVLLAATLACVLLATGCSSGGANPLTPAAPDDLTAASVNNGNTQTHLWGYFDVYIDVPAQTATAVLNRNAMFAANVVQYVNGNPANLQFNIIGTPAGPGHVDVDIDVTISHPFPGMTMYNGYDVRGIFIGNASGSLSYNPALTYAVYNFNDQVMYDYDLTEPDTHNGKFGNPDGYTRWWNPSEFLTPGMFGYTPGAYATPSYTGTGTLNPYRYFADGLGVTDNLFAFLISTTGNGVFTAGSSNTRNYYLRFPVPSPAVKFGYAIVADWKGEAPEDHPANAPEAVGLAVAVDPDVYWVPPDGADRGGKLKLDMSFPTTWGEQPSVIVIESTVLSSPYQLTPDEMIPVGGDINYLTYHVEISADYVNSNEGNEFWVIAQYDNYDYSNPFGVPNGTGSDKLAACFRYDLFVADKAYNKPPVCDLDVLTAMPATGWVPVPVQFDASGSSDPDPGDVFTFAWDFDGDNIFGESPDDDYTGTPPNPTHVYGANFNGVVHLKLTDTHAASTICSTPPLSVTIKTSCSSMTPPDNQCWMMVGTNRIYYYNPEGTRAANPARVLGGYNNGNEISAISAGGGIAVYFLYSSGYYFYNLACTSTDRVYFNDSGSSNQLYYCQYDNTTGFTQMRTSFGPVIPSGSIWRVVVDKGDNPIVLAYTSGTNCIVYHWNGSSWGSGITVSSAIMTAAGSYGNINDFDYDPTTGYYLFVERNGVPGIGAMNSAGVVMWSDTDI